MGRRPAGAGGLPRVRLSSSSDPASPGLAAADASADAAVPPILTSAPCNGALACERILFVTALRYPANLGGASGGDAKCTEVAHQSKFPRLQQATFNAWLQISGTGAIERVTGGTQAYAVAEREHRSGRLRTLAQNGFVHVPPDENAVEIGGPAWSGADPGGRTCGDWGTSDHSVFGVRGQIELPGDAWQTVEDYPCDQTAHLYCLEN